MFPRQAALAARLGVAQRSLLLMKLLDLLWKAASCTSSPVSLKRVPISMPGLLVGIGQAGVVLCAVVEAAEAA